MTLVGWERGGWDLSSLVSSHSLLLYQSVAFQESYQVSYASSLPYLETGEIEKALTRKLKLGVG